MFRFEDKIEVIDKLIESRRGRWTLDQITYMDWADVAQLIRIHIADKWEQWDQSRPLEKWASKVIKHRIINLIRDHYGKVTPPCVTCPFNTNLGGCSRTRSGKQDNDCLAYRKWEKRKGSAYGLKLAAPLEDYDGAGTSIDFDMIKSIDKFHDQMKVKLNEKLWNAYTLLYIEHLNDTEVVKRLGFKTKEKDRLPGYRQLSNMKAKIIKVAKELIQDFDIEHI
jgi:hypothetical protein